MNRATAEENDHRLQQMNDNFSGVSLTELARWKYHGDIRREREAHTRIQEQRTRNGNNKDGLDSKRNETAWRQNESTGSIACQKGRRDTNVLGRGKTREKDKLAKLR